MAAHPQVVSGVIIPVGSLHVDILRLPSIETNGRISLEQVSQASACPLDDLAPTFNALELCDELMARKGEDVFP